MVLTISHYTEGGHHTPGSVLAISFELNGLEHVAINGGPMYKFSPALSLMVDMDSRKVTRVTQAMLKMIKLDSVVLLKAAGEAPQ